MKISNAIIFKIMPMAMAAVFLLAGSSNSFGQNIIREIANRMDIHNKSIQTLQADILMTSYDAALKDSETRRGAFKYIPQSKASRNIRWMRLDWTGPSESILVKNDEVEIYQPDRNQVIRSNAKSQKAKEKGGGALAFINMSKSELAQNYDVKLIGEENLSDGTQTAHLQITPKVKTSYASADIWVDKDGMVRQARENANNGDNKTFFISNVRKNQTLAKSDFDLGYPKNVSVIKG